MLPALDGVTLELSRDSDMWRLESDDSSEQVVFEEEVVVVERRVRSWRSAGAESRQRCTQRTREERRTHGDSGMA